MAAYLVLARKYRPATFGEVVGQEPIAATLVSAINSGRVAHAFLFGGTRGVGKTSMARILAKALNCLKAEAPTAKPCNKCEACAAIGRGDDVDVIEIDGASNRGIEEIRQLRANAIYRPNRCRYRVYYIDEVHMLTKEAFNALLKTLEEPPEHVKFVFATTEPGRLPATIISRCQRFDFRNIPTRLIAGHLKDVCKKEKVKVAEGAIFRIARAAGGSMRDGLSLLDQLLAAGEGKVAEQDVVRILGTPEDERTSALAAAIADGQAGAALTELDGLLAAGVTLESALAAVGEMFRNMMLAKICGGESELIELPDSQKKQVAELAEKFTVPALVQAVATCQTTARGLRGLTSGRGLVEAALVRLAEAEKFVDADSLIRRLEGLAGTGAAARSTGPPAAGDLAQPRRSPGPPPGRGQKKKTVADDPPDAAATLPPKPQPQQPPAALQDPRWEVAYLRSHWEAVAEALAGARQGQVAGLLRPAKVLGLDGETLKLGYDQAQERLRQQARRQDAQVTAALGGLFARRVRCEYVCTGQAGESIVNSNNGSVVLSSAQRRKLAADPAVKAVMDFFDGSITNVGRLPPAGGAAEEDENES